MSHFGLNGFTPVVVSGVRLAVAAWRVTPGGGDFGNFDWARTRLRVVASPDQYSISTCTNPKLPIWTSGGVKPREVFASAALILAVVPTSGKDADPPDQETTKVPVT